MAEKIKLCLTCSARTRHVRQWGRWLCTDCGRDNT